MMTYLSRPFSWLLVLSLLSTVTLLADPVSNANTHAIDSTETGGLFLHNMGGPEVVVLNCQTTIPDGMICPAVGHIKGITHLPISIQSLSRKAQASPAKIIRDAMTSGTNPPPAAVILLDATGSNEPSLLVAPDNHWAIINVDALSSDMPDGPHDQVLAERMRKELWRATCLVIGACGSVDNPKCVLGAVDGMKGLDAAGNGPGLDALPRIFANAKRMGIRQMKLETYRQAVQEGWAPQPTNNMQRAIWQQEGKN